MRRLRWPRLGLRREILILLPVTVFLLVLLSGITLFSYRSALDLLTEERQRQLAIVTQKIARDLESGSWPPVTELRQRIPAATRISISTTDGRPVRTFGPRGTGKPLAPLDGQIPTGVVSLGPDEIDSATLVGFAPFTYQDEAFILRIDLPAHELARQRQTVRLLTWFVLPIDLALLVLALAFLPHFLRPYDTLVEKVQSVAPETGADDDISTLVSTIDRALVALSSASAAATEDDIVALQRALGTGLESGVLLVDTAGRILTLNPAGGAMLDLEPVAEPISAATYLAAHPELQQMLARALAGQEGLPRREIHIQTGAGRRTLGFTVHTLRRDDGTARGHLALFADLTESQREAEARQLATSLAQLGELAAGVAHELRNSLATLQGYLTLLDRHPDEESITDYVQEIRRESDHLERVVRDFLAFAQPESARIETIDLEAIARAAADDPALADMPVEVLTEGAGGWWLQGDAQLLERAIRNLLHNAAEAERQASGDGPIVVRLRRLPEAIEMHIEDRGPGLPDEVRQRLFQPFVSGRTDGVGLGLSLTHRIATLHGGRIDLEDRTGGGTRVRLSLPPVEPPSGNSG